MYGNSAWYTFTMVLRRITALVLILGVFSATSPLAVVPHGAVLAATATTTATTTQPTLVPQSSNRASSQGNSSLLNLGILGGIGLGIIGLSLFSSSGASSAAPTGYPFGGRITSITPCNTGTWITVGPPRPASLLWIPGVSLTYLQGPPRHVGQWVLGMANTASAPCVVGIYVIGYGLIIRQIGTSLAV